MDSDSEQTTAEEDIRDMNMDVTGNSDTFFLCTLSMKMIEDVIPFQFLFTRLDEQKSDNLFVCKLKESLIKHIAKRRTIASRCARFIHYGKKWSALDGFLELSPNAPEAGISDVALEQEITKFYLEIEESEMQGSEGSTPMNSSSDFESYSKSLRHESRTIRSSNPLDRAQRRARLQMQLIEEFEEGRSVTDHCPKLMTSIVETLRPTSVAAERGFSKARNIRRYNQELLNDERFARKLLLKDFYSKNKPWNAYEKTLASTGEEPSSD